MSELVDEKDSSKPQMGRILLSWLVVVVLTATIWGSALVTFWSWWSGPTGRARTCGPRIGVECPPSVGYGVAAMFLMVFATIALMVIPLEKSRGPLPFLVIPAILGIGLGGRFAWAAVVHAEGVGSRIFMAVLAIALLYGLGYRYGRVMVRDPDFSRSLFLAVRVENKVAVLPEGRDEKRQWAVFVAANAIGLIVGVTAGLTLIRG